MSRFWSPLSGNYSYVGVWSPTSQPSLYHYGVLGMKWGVRKAYKYNNKIRSRQFKQMHIEEKSKLGKKDPRIDELDKKNFSDDAKRSAAVKRAVTRSGEHLQKLDAKYRKAQAKADAKYQKAERKANSLFSTKKSAKKAFNKAAKAQFKANKVAYKGKHFYEEMMKSMNLDYSPKRSVFYGSIPQETRSLGKGFVKRVERNSKAMYAASYAGG